jgi:hypothetical protein
MVEYRRGIAKKRKNDFWHWHPDCELYPFETFAIRQDKPWDGDLCSECDALSRELRHRPVA